MKSLQNKRGLPLITSVNSTIISYQTSLQAFTNILYLCACMYDLKYISTVFAPTITIIYGNKGKSGKDKIFNHVVM